MTKFEEVFWEQQLTVVGVDEAGRGPLAGPLVVAGVVLPAYFQDPLIQDSKQLTPKKRAELRKVIEEVAIWYQIVVVDVYIIDRDNIYQATKQAMMEIVQNSGCHGLIDAMKLDGVPHTAIIKGDQQSISIASASILAKCYRDEYMEALHIRYPQYNFAGHKGYPTKEHFAKLEEYGVTPEHRLTFAGLGKYQKEQK